VQVVSLSLGLFDVFTYIVPGSLYLSITIYLGNTFGWMNLGQLKNVPSIVVVGGILVASYVLGIVTNPLAAALDRSLRPWKGVYDADVRQEFVSRVPSASGRPYVQSDFYLLLAAAEMNDKEAALEISRLRAVGLMIRNCTVPLLVACTVSIIDVAFGKNVPAAVVCSVLFASATLSGIHQGKRLRQWANMKTLEICYWIPDIDGIFQRARHSSGRSRNQAKN
jgi:hypothetical protein